MALTYWPAFVGGTYRNTSPILGSDTCKNLIPVKAESPTTKGPFGFTNIPGKELMTTFGTSPGRGIWSGDETRIFCVSGDRLYTFDFVSTAVVNRGAVGNDGNPVTWAHNGLTQLAICSNSKLYVDSGAGPVEITACPASVAAGGQGVLCVVTVDGYAIVAELNTNNIYISAIGDFTSWDPLDKQVWYAAQDRVIQLSVDANHRLWLWGRKTAEAWGNIGGSGFPFARIPGAALNVGLGARFGVTMCPSINGTDQTVFIGRNDRGGPRVYMLNGYQAVRISNDSIEQIMANYGISYDCVANAYVDRGNSMVMLSFPDAGSMLVYDSATGLWHERYKGDYAGYTEPRGRFHTSPVISPYANRQHYWLDGATGALYRDDVDLYREDGNDIYWERTGPNANNDGQFVFCGCIRLDCEVGVGSSVDGITLEVSYDNGLTWGAARARSTGVNGATRTLLDWNRNGSGTNIVPRFRGHDALAIAIINAAVDLEPGAGY